VYLITLQGNRSSLHSSLLFQISQKAPRWRRGGGDRIQRTGGSHGQATGRQVQWALITRPLRTRRSGVKFLLVELERIDWPPFVGLTKTLTRG